MFKIGDRVKCVNPGGSRVLVMGGVYTVLGITVSGCIVVREVQVKHAYYPGKFVKVRTFKGNK